MREEFIRDLVQGEEGRITPAHAGRIDNDLGTDDDL